MEQLGPNIQVILSLKEGKGFDRICNPTCIVATLNGHSLETDNTEAACNPQYITDLMWKADKNGLRKMRSSQEPLKIECFEIKEHGKRDRIGYVILSLRQARIIAPRDTEVRIPVTWHRLMGLRNDMKVHRPELSLALTIEEHETYIQRISRQEETPVIEKTPSNLPVAPANNSAVPYLVEDECLIQLGPAATCRTLFLLNITAVTAQNFHQLRGQTAEKSGDNYSLWYRILDNDVRLKSFESLQRRWTLNENLVIKIRSSLNVLRNYFREQPNFLLLLQHGETILGHSEVDISSLIPGDSAEDSLMGENGGFVLSNRCILIGPQTTINVGDGEDNRAFLDLQLRLVCDGTKKLVNATDSGKLYEAVSRLNPDVEYSQDGETNPRNIFSEIDLHRNPCGDSGKCVSGDSRIIGCKGFQCKNENDGIPLPRTFAATGNSCNERNHSKSVEAYHCYCLNVSLTGIKLSSSVENVEFRFHHPKAEIMSTLYPKMPLLRDEKLRLQDIGCKLHFISAADEIRHLLLSFPPKFSVCDATNESRTCVGKTILNVGLLFDRNKLETKYEAALYDTDKSPIGAVDVAMHLEDHGPYYKTCKRASGENLGPPIIDDSLAYKIVEELESWKDRQQEIFRVELKRKEDRHLNRLSEEWQKRRENLESKLACSVEQCKMLANSLNKATEDLRTRRLKSLEKEARLIKANEDLQWRFDSNVQELQEASRLMQAEFVSKINLLEEQRNALEAELEPLRIENEQLRRLSSQQAEELEAYQKGSLTQDQTASLLQDVKALEQKLANAQANKSFFKEQWAKAVREIHRMRMEHQQAIEVQIKTSKEELKNFDLEDVLCADSNALSDDQILLGQLQKEIDVIKPRPFSSKTSTSQQIFAPIEALYPQQSCKSHRSSAKSEEQDERVRNLIEERSALLKTGSYNNDDAIIVKLNAEIRSLLISS